MFVLEEVFVCWLASPVVVSFMATQALHPPSPTATSSCAVASSEEEGLHTLPHILGVYINIVAVFFGGGRIGTSPFLLTMSRSSPEEEGLALLLILPVCTSEGEGQAFSHTTTVTTSEEDRPSSSQCR